MTVQESIAKIDERIAEINTYPDWIKDSLIAPELKRLESIKTMLQEAYDEGFYYGRLAGYDEGKGAR